MTMKFLCHHEFKPLGLLQKWPPSSRGCFLMSFCFKEKSFRNLILNSPKFHSSNPIANRSSLVLVKACMTSLNKPQFTGVCVCVIVWMCVCVLCYLRRKHDNFCDSQFHFDPSLKCMRILNYEKHLGLLIALKCFVLVRVMLTSANVTAGSAS